MKIYLDGHTEAEVDSDLKSPARSDRARREAQVRKKIFAGVARTIRKAARSYHIGVEGCAGAEHKRGGIVECKKEYCVRGFGMYFKFTADDAETLLSSIPVVSPDEQEIS